MQATLDIIFRWMHIMAACLAVGGAFFMRFLLPIGMRELDPETRESVFLRTRRAFKFVVHPAILAFLVSGIYNTLRVWPRYREHRGLAHGLFGAHLLLALAVITISLILLAGREPRRSHRGLLKLNVVLMVLAIAAASSLKWVRDSRPGPDSSGADLRLVSQAR